MAGGQREEERQLENGKRSDRESEVKTGNIRERTNEFKKCFFEGNGISNRQYITSVFFFYIQPS